MSSGGAPDINVVLTGDCLDLLPRYPANFFSLCLTDPPYHDEFAGKSWNHDEIQRRVGRVRDSSTLIKHMPYGSGLAGGVRNARWYARNREEVRLYREWCETWGRGVYRTLRPGAFILVFSGNRTAAHVQVGLENAGFYPRDVLVWPRPAGIPRGYNHAAALRKQNDPQAAAWEGWHSCLRNAWEAILILQKPLLNNYAQTLQESGVGLLRAQEPGQPFRTNILPPVQKSAGERTIDHLTVKPLALVQDLMALTLPASGERHVVLDPFAGSGTTCVAARNLDHDYVAMEREPEYAERCRARLACPQA